MKKFIVIQLCLLVLLVTNPVLALTPGQESNNDPLVRIKDITRVKGVRNNQLIGYGLVVGLNGTGDGGSDQTVQSIANMLNEFGVKVDPSQLGADNVAAVMVTADLPPFARSGDEIDVTLSSVGEADSLQGGTLLMTPLQGPAREKVYAVAQGSVSIGGFNAQQGGNQVRQNHSTVGRVPNGAIIERSLDTKFAAEGKMTLVLAEPNFSTAQRIADVINSKFGYTPQGGAYAQAMDGGRVQVKIPQHFTDNKVGFMSRVGQLEVRPDTDAKVVVNERTGTIVMGHNVRLSKVSVAHGNLTVTIETNEEVSQPAEDSEGETAIEENTEVEVNEEEKKLMVLPKGATISDVVKGLNAAGAKPRDVISILQAIKEAGALHADLEIM
ncbi:flagellar basal body P-ring protein FlgI [Halanaerobaculum tunisiense]